MFQLYKIKKYKARPCIFGKEEDLGYNISVYAFKIY